MDVWKEVGSWERGGVGVRGWWSNVKMGVLVMRRGLVDVWWLRWWFVIIICANISKWIVVWV